MAKGNHHALLMEILIAVLFFAVASTVILNTFAAAHSQSQLAGVTADALVQAQNLAESMYAQSADGEEAFLTARGFEPDGSEWTLDCGEYALAVEMAGLSEENVFCAEISAVRDGETLVSLPYARYIPSEVSE